MSRSLAMALCVSLSLSAAVGCVSKGNKISEKEKSKVEQYVTEKAPAGITELNINFDDKITLLGYTLTPNGTVRGGEQAKMTLYWRVDKALGEKGWGLFTHIFDAAGKRLANIDNVGPLREWRKTQQLLPPSDWEQGKVYVDEQSFEIPKRNKTNELQITTGIWKGQKRLSIKSGPKLSNDRALIATLKFAGGGGGGGGGKSSTRVPNLRVDRLEPGIELKIDGKLDEPVWTSAPSAGPFVSVRTGEMDKASPVQGTARLLWNDENLFVGFEVTDKNVTGGFDKDAKDPHLWTKDTVEIMIDPDGDGDNKDYYEIQVNPQNLVFDSQFDDYNKPKTEPDGPFGHQEWSAKLHSAVVVDGTVDKPGDEDKGYTVEIGIPWSSFGKAKKAPPQLGDRWRINLYAMQDNSGVAWSPILGQGNFHKASRFGKVTWVEKGWKPAHKATAKATQGKASEGEATEGKAGAAGEGPTVPAKRTVPSVAPGALSNPKLKGNKPAP